MRADFIGIDLTSSSRKPSAYVGLSTELQISLGFLQTDSQIIAAVEQNRPALVAIDAPLGLPKGLCCLEESCPCQPLSPSQKRVCESQLAGLGIPCFFTTKKSIIKEMVYRAIKLKDELSERGYQVIEVYPYASKVRLFGKPIPSKLKPQGLKFLQEHLVSLIPDLAQSREKLNHDLCDAALAAYTAYLYYQGKAELLGDEEEGQIVIPALKEGI